MAIVAAELNDTDPPPLDGLKAGGVRGWTLIALVCLAAVAVGLVALQLPRTVEHFAAVPEAAATALVAATTPKIPVP